VRVTVTDNADESYPEVDGVTHSSGVYKIPMVRMYENWVTKPKNTDEIPNVRV